MSASVSPPAAFSNLMFRRQTVAEKASNHTMQKVLMLDGKEASEVRKYFYVQMSAKTALQASSRRVSAHRADMGNFTRPDCLASWLAHQTEIECKRRLL